ncbi:MAG TPA: hypothetical protein VFA33_19430 [Bryobacteraceae bacterium]|nr:hypothetical protein [Bryobacteraceae bacterium]
MASPIILGLLISAGLVLSGPAGFAAPQSSQTADQGTAEKTGRGSKAGTKKAKKAKKTEGAAPQKGSRGPKTGPKKKQG